MEYGIGDNITVNVSEENVRYWAGVCGDQQRKWALWDPSLTMNTTNPDLPLCLQNLFLVWVPCLVLWLSAPCRLFYLSTIQSRHPLSRLSKLCIAKLTLTLLLLLLALVYLFMTIGYHHSEPTVPMAFMSPVFAALTLLLALCVIHTEYRKARHTSGVMLVFWFVLLIAGAFKIHSFVRTANILGHVEDVTSLSLFVVAYVVTLALLVVTLFPDLDALHTDHCMKKSGSYSVKNNGVNEAILLKPQQDAFPTDEDRLKQCPEITAPFIARITFMWLTGLVIRGYKKALELPDLWNVRPGDKSSFIHQKFDWAWNAEITRLKNLRVQVETPESNGRASSPKKRKTPDSKNDKDYANVATDEKDDTKEEKPEDLGPSLWKIYFKTYGMHYGAGAMYKFVFDAISIIQPLLLGALVDFTMDAEKELWKGLVIAFILFATTWVRQTINGLHANAATTCAMRIRCMLMGAVYRKALRLSSAGKKQFTTGEIVNMAAVDAHKLFEVFQNLNFLWSTPIVLVVSMVLLWQQLGIAALAGLAMIIFILPINGYFARMSRVLQTANMEHKDRRLKLLNEILNGIKVLKLYGWEESFKHKVNEIRATEVKALSKAAIVDSVAFCTWFLTPFVISLASFGVYIAASADNVLDAHTAFVSLALIYIMHGPILITSIMIGQLIHAVVATKRLRKFLSGDEIDDSYVTEQDDSSDAAITIENGTFTWEKDLPPTLKDINLSIKEGNLTAIVGMVGSGKTSLISALLGEMTCLKGNVKIRGTTAYVPQLAWVQNNTVRDNILFGRPLTDGAYQRCLDACALRQDLSILAAGDETAIGDKGVNLSGGQKQRVSLARAMYQDCQVYLLDDPLSAVDAHVGKHIFRNVIGNCGYLKDRTRVLVTHNLAFLPKVDHVIVLNENGTVEDQGTYEELLGRGGAFSDFLQNYVIQRDEDGDCADEEEDEDDPDLPSPQRIKADVIRQLSDPGSPMVRRACSKEHKLKPQPFLSRAKSLEQLSEVKKQMKEVVKQKDEEKVEIGDVSLRVYGKYFASFGFVMYVSLAVCYIFYLISLGGASVWLQVWSDSLENSSLAYDHSYSQRNLGIYAAFGVLQTLFIFGSTLALALGALRASKNLHCRMLSCMLRSPMTFFDTTPLGRITNRFAKDVDQLDVYLPWVTRIWMATLSTVVTTVVVIIYCIPAYLILLIPMIVLYFMVQRFYIRTTRQLKRLEAVSRSPLLSLIGETSQGTSCIRAYGKADEFMKTADSLIDGNTKAVYPNLMSYRWLQFILDQVGIFTVLFISLYGVCTRDYITGGLVGLAISFQMRSTSVLSYVVRMTCDVESAIVSAERIIEYSSLPSEAPLELEAPKKLDWSAGDVKFEAYSTRYRPDLDLVLRQVTLQIKAGEKLGVVGRTGSGKSTLTLALFRILEPAAGKILIGDVDITKLGLHQLRSKITIIPQDPVLFCGSLRENLDPFDECSDEQIWSCLEHSQLKDYFKAQPQQLEFVCDEGGSNLSAGQKQLVCLARALLRNSRIIVLDEATASVDVETDDFIQRTIRETFSDATVIVIAHRLNTIMDCDRVLVLDRGQVAELDAPTYLIKSSRSIFHGMAVDAGLV